MVMDSERMTNFESLQIEQKKENKRILWILNCLSCLVSLALFGIPGMILRYYLDKLFGPEVLSFTRDDSPLYYDLLPNMVGSFLMGWLGVVFKGDIASISDNLAVGLTTGFLGSLTTFSGWNQKLVELTIEHQWVTSVGIIFLGVVLVEAMIERGIETAEKWKGKKRCSKLKIFSHEGGCDLQNYNYLTATLLLVVVFIIVLGTCTTLGIREFNHADYDVKLLLACIVVPFGVWTRYFLACVWNDHDGIGEKAWLKWVPFGTLVANVSAASIMAALAALKKEVKNDTFYTIAAALQLGFCGCLSTVSTLVAEHYKLKRGGSLWRAYAYTLGTIAISFTLGIAIYVGLSQIKVHG
ncbi:OLC1v1035239C1 [Oldenlandia corymbosa var. corymbosa]|uniref:OLC1v1035239C1 n=1 Tax=Oldenlandia corymbosa var. corymbosa TaxID=529605 RepID=A0AAV1CSG8_OLDCO|nr:OLC1v1035239C1 [Oldenlandia corymbosa var. corymbosa]